jgi:hypothetical protein
MNAEEFNKLVKWEQDREFKVLCERGEVYAGKDRFRNFKNIARITGSTPQKALFGMFLKHFEAWMGFMEKPTIYTSFEQWQEKIGDMRNYLILCLGMVGEEYKDSFGLKPGEIVWIKEKNND